MRRCESDDDVNKKRAAAKSPRHPPHFVFALTLSTLAPSSTHTRARARAHTHTRTHTHTLRVRSPKDAHFSR
jgi:hypothetical protein